MYHDTFVFKGLLGDVAHDVTCSMLSVSAQLRTSEIRVPTPSYLSVSLCLYTNGALTQSQLVRY